MALNEDEMKYQQVIASLKQLQKVKVPENFELELMRKINSGKYAEKKRSFLEKLFIPARLIPSAGVAVAAVILFFVMNTESDEFENPLLIKPRIREDAPISIQQVLQPPAAELKRNLIKKEKTAAADKDNGKKEYYGSDLNIPEPKGTDKNPAPKISAPEPLGFVRLDSINSLDDQLWKENDSFFSQNVDVPGNYPLVRGASGEVYQITKSGLNYRQVNIVEEERQQITQLKAKMKSLMNQTSKALKIK
ncbi:MAG TPA: hypothetical protein VMT35_09040 [Ignavibacteriaceae bacterium]|nr:hypothetical protein [Ignavibacteriaceae bacterium]